MNKELMEALNILEKEKEISKETLFEAIENSLMLACKNHFGKAEEQFGNARNDCCQPTKLFCIALQLQVRLQQHIREHSEYQQCA